MSKILLQDHVFYSEQSVSNVCLKQCYQNTCLNTVLSEHLSKTQCYQNTCLKHSVIRTLVQNTVLSEQLFCTVFSVYLFKTMFYNVLQDNMFCSELYVSNA